MITVVSSGGNTIQIHNGGRKPPIANRIISLTADGEELEVIKREFANIPYPRNAKVVVWKDSIARLIYDHI